MSMYPCVKCKSNSWDFELKGECVEAVCKKCSNKVSFKKAEKIKVDKVGDKCRCGKAEVVYVEAEVNEQKLKKAFYYRGFLECPMCFKRYYKSEFEVLNEEACGKNIEISLNKAKKVSRK